MLGRMPDQLADQFGASIEEVIALYEEWAASGTYDRDVDDWGYEAPDRGASKVADAMARYPGRVLDAGCGTGLVGAALAAVGVDDIVGGDVSPASLEVARDRGVYTDLIPLDLTAPLDLADGSFAATVSIGVFTYVADLDTALRELLRVVAPGGSVIFTQRTDLWAERNCDAILTDLVDEGLCTADITGPQPYLPGHPEFGDAVHIRYVTLVKRS